MITKPLKIGTNGAPVEFDLETELTGLSENFSYKTVPAATTVTIPLNQQMIVIDSIIITGTLTIIGELFLLGV